MERLLGEWFIVQSTLPLWKSNANARVEYKQEKDGRVGDVVRFTGRNLYCGLGARRERTIPGVDERVDDAKLAF